MDIYSLSTLLGLVGLVGMAVLGALGGHDASHAGHGHSAHSAHGGDHASPFASSRAPHLAHPARVAPPLRLLEFLAPRALFTLALGFGLTGMLLRSSLPTPLTLLLALAGALAFELLLVAPLYRFALRFASKPARSLESATFAKARAVTDFDAQGDGLIELELNGEVRQVLGQLEREERIHGVAVRRGDAVRVTAVNPSSGHCTVSRVQA